MGKRISTRYELIILFLVALIVFSLPTVIRWSYLDNPSIIGFTSYYHERMAFSEGDELSFGGRERTYPPLFSPTIAIFSLVFGNLGGLILVSLLGAISVVFFYKIVREHIEKRYAFLASLLFMLLPGVIYFNGHLSSRAPPIALGVAALYFFMQKGNKNLALSGILLGLAALFHPEIGFLFLVIMLYPPKLTRKKAYALILGLAIGSAFYLPFIASYGLPEFNDLHRDYRDRMYSLESTSTEQFFFEASSNGYLIIPLVILAIFGAVKGNNRSWIYWALVVVALSLFAERFAIHMTIPIALLAAIGIMHLGKIDRKKFITIISLVLIYALVVSSVRVVSLAEYFPTREQYDTMLWIGENTPQDSTILSDWVWGHWITGIAERKSFVDGYSEYAPQVNARMAALRTFYQTCKIPEGYNISYVYMEQWFIAERGINCLDNFERVYENSGFLVLKV